MKLIEAAVIETGLPSLHLDHGDSFEQYKSCVDGGFTSVMIDASHHSFEENIAITKQVVDYAHAATSWLKQAGSSGRHRGCSERNAADLPTRAETSGRIRSAHRCRLLAIAIGTNHGAYSSRVKQLRFDILEEVQEGTWFPIILHGASSVIPEYVDDINKYGGKMHGARACRGYAQKGRPWPFARSISTPTSDWP